ncbi:MAG: BTAD domain-containing putative transcriptional regulator [Nakamurella sp.]
MTDSTEPPSDPYLCILGAASLAWVGRPSHDFTQTQRRILARAALAAPNPVTVDELVDAVWPGGGPASARQAIQNQVSRIRQSAASMDAELIVTASEGYRLELATDAQMLRDGAVEAERILTTGENPEAAFDLADAALQLMRGDPFTDIEHIHGVLGARRTVEAAVAMAENIRVEAAIALGRRAWSLTEAERLASAAPLDECRAANLARALALAGRRGDALATVAEIRRRLRTELGIESGPDIAAVEDEILHGVGSPVPALRRPAPPHLVGRDTELREILRAVAQRRPVRVRGEHGSGVSRMLFEIRGRLIALGVKVVLVRADQHPPSAMSLIEEILDEMGVSVTHSHSALTTFIATLEEATEVRPIALIVDDVHFLGPSVWAAIIAAVAAPYVGVVLGGHGHEVAIEDEAEVVLSPLDLDSIGALSRHRGVTDAARVDWLATHSGGNPLAVQVLAGMMVDGAELAGKPGMTMFSAVTPDVASLVDRLTAHFDADRRRDLDLAAVAGDGFPAEALARVPWPRLPEPPEDLVISADDGTLRFRHGAVQALVYQGIPRGVATDWHYVLGIAAAEVGAAPATVARHLLAAAELDPGRAIDAARAAAMAAGALGAHADAVDWLAQALAVDLTDDPARAIAVSIEYADALRLAGDPSHLDASLSAVRNALEFGDDKLIAAAAFAMLQLGASSIAGDVQAEVSEVAFRAIGAISDPELRAPVQAAASLAWSMTGHADTSRTLFDEAEATAKGPAARLRTLPFAYLAVGRPGDLARRAALATELIELAEAADEPVPLWEGWHLQFSVKMQYGDGPALRECLQQMQRLVGRVGDVGRRWSVLYSAASVAHLDGDLDLSERLATQAFAMFAPVSMSRAAASYYAQLLPLRADQGRLAELRTIVESMVFEQPGVTAWHAAAALILASAGDDAARAQALEHAERALDLAQDDFTWMASHVLGGRAAALLEDATLADRYLRRLEPWADLICWQGTCSYGPIADVLAELSDVLGAADAAESYRARADALRERLSAATI